MVSCEIVSKSIELNGLDLRGLVFNLRRYKKTPQFLAGFLERIQKSLQTF
jgi:hypothetical protein